MSVNFTYTVKIYAEDYLCYNIERFDILSKFVNSRSFDNSIDLFRTYFKAYLQNEYPSLRFDNIILTLNDVIVVNQPDDDNRSFSF